MTPADAALERIHQSLEQWAVVDGQGEPSDANDGFPALTLTVGEARSLLTRLSADAARVGEMEAALEQIADWLLPETGKFWTNADGTESDRPLPYEVEYGSVGARRYVQNLARAALKDHSR